MASYGSADYYDPVGHLARRRKARKERGAAAGTLSAKNIPAAKRRKRQVDSDVAVLMRQLRKGGR